MKTVFILGAGASYVAGAPLMADFLDRAHDLYWRRNELVMKSAEAFADVFQAQADLQSLFAKAYLNINNLESLFSAVDIAQVIGKFGARDADLIPGLRSSLVTVIYKTLEASMNYPVQGGYIRAPRPYGDFVDMIFGLLEKEPFRQSASFSFITFNYDTGLDFALTRRRSRFHYALPGNTQMSAEKSFASARPSNGSVPLLKLHGSINWLSSPIDGNLSVITLDNLTTAQGFRDDNSDTRVHVTSQFVGNPKSGRADWTPLIVPPTWNKTGQQPHLSDIWRAAAHELGEADNIIVIGYSLPETDLFFRFLFSLGVDSTKRIRRFWVFDPSEAVRSRFAELIGSAIRDRFEFRPWTFAKAIGPIGHALQHNEYRLPQ